jgi:fibronectin type 3 domain-containing protein
MAPAGTICRASTDTNQCDPAETCTGTSVTCPADVKYASPAVPTGVTAAPGTLLATISWTAASGATGYNVKQSVTPGSGYTTQGTPPTAAASPYVNIGLTGGTTYYYVVSSVNTIATCESGNSTQTSVTPTGICTPPAVPTVTPTSSNGQVSLSWTASTGATSYGVARSTTTGTGYASVATVTTGTTYSDINVSNGTTYYYVVTASNGTCSSAKSVEVSGTPSCTPPVVPTGLVATGNNGSVALTWSAPAGAVSYRVLRSTTSGSGYVLLGTSGTASYTDTNVTNGTTYYYVVTASNGVCSSANSAQAPATPACTPPSKPTGLAATPGNGQIALAWTASTGGATLYQVLRGAATGGPYTAIATPTSTGYTDTGLLNGTTYYYVVNASNGSCSSANSAELAAAPVCTPPSVPTITAAPGDGQVVLSWTAATGGTVSYVLSRGTVSGGPYGTVVASPTVLTYTDKTAVNGTTYYYVVSSFNGTCYSANSAEVLAKPVAACNLVAPTGVTATPLSQQVRLNWTAVANATSYGIGRSTTAGTGYTSVGTVTAPTVTFLDTAATNGTKYYYVVTASNTLCTSPGSTEVSATPVCTPPAVPTGVAATANNSNGNIGVSWGTVTDATGYTVSRGNALAGPFTAVSTNQTAATYTDSTGLVAGTVYYYVVSASNAGGTCASANSTPAVSARSCSLPAVPSGVSATAGISRVTVRWTASSGSPTSYEVKRGNALAGPFTSIGTPTATSYVDSNVTNGQTYYYVVAARNAGGLCSSANSGAQSTAPRSCTVWSGAAGGGHPGKFNTVGPICYVTCDVISGGWGCYWQYAARTININGSQLSCGTTPVPAAKTPGYTVIDVSAGTVTQDEIWWWGTYNSPCSIPSGGLDF